MLAKSSKSCPSETSHSAASEQGDLLSSVSELQQPSQPVALVHLDSASPREVKVVTVISNALTMLALACVIAFFIVGWTVQRSRPSTVFHTNAFEIGNLAVGSCCFIFLAGFLAQCLRRCWQIRRLGLEWKRRRKRMASLAILGGCLQAVNLISWIAANAHSVRVRCSWFSTTINVLNIVTWSTWNTLLYAYSMSAYSLNIWHPKKAELAKSIQHPLIMDAPWTIYLTHLYIWVLFELTIVVPQIAFYSISDQFLITPRQKTGPDCRYWEYDCLPSGFMRGFSVVWAVMLILHSMQFYYFTIKTQYQLRSQPFSDFRASNMLLKLEKGSARLLYKTAIISVIMLSLIRPHGCWVYVLDWLGFMPVQISATTFITIELFLFTPSKPGAGPSLERWLQEPAWAEEEKGDKQAARMASANSPEDTEALQRLPMAVMGWAPGLVVLAFRGTSSMRNALSDLKIMQMDHPVMNEIGHLGRRVQVHSGFYSAWAANGLNDKIIKRLKSLISCGRVARNARICVTGHSLGGALAVLAAHDIHLKLQPARLQVLTFGCPYVGNAAFKREYEAHVPDTWHIMHEADPVPHAGKFFGLFKRAGQRVIINALGELLVQPSPLEVRIQRGSKIRDHFLVAYRLALLAVCRMQFTARGTTSGRAGVLAMGQDPALYEDMSADGFEWAEMQKAARQAVLSLKACSTQEAAENAAAETRAADAVEFDYSANLDFGGISTQTADEGMIIQGAAKAAGKNNQVLKPLISAAKVMEVCKDTYKLISSCVEDSGVREGASEDLRAARGAMSTISSRLQALLRNHSGEVSEQGGRMCVAVLASDDPSSRGMLLGSTAGGSMMFIEPPSAVNLNNELAAARGRAKTAEDAILWKLTGAIAEDMYNIESCYHTVAWLDEIAAKARFGRWIDGRFATFVPFPKTGRARSKAAKDQEAARDSERGTLAGADEYVRLRRLRHPLLIADYLRSSASKRQNQQSQAKAGGKTATLKAVGLTVLMAKAGLPTPAQEPIYIPPFSRVLADIGDEQSLSANLSTFSAHLRQIQSLRQESDGKALVLLDEVGTGTDPIEGAALGAAVLKALCQGGARGAALTLATSHHGSLSLLKYEDERFENASVEFDDEKLCPTYRLLWGLPGRSNVLNIAARLGMEAGVIDQARSLMGSDQERIDSDLQEWELRQRSTSEDEAALRASMREQARLKSKMGELRYGCRFVEPTCKRLPTGLKIGKKRLAQI
ncbi:hypothetical protein WJX73_000666 [Symbiochloris irregularis]|uniref:DNA mismatch repair proteins mutS family domain-containing protein n=1 Tax=Symbiochloris irregularis TaxID=706552 RepID=A0AAW1PGQ7_9CHLO